MADDQDRKLGTYPIANLPPLRLLDDELHIGAQSFTVPDDQFGMAMAFTHFVNLRRSQDPRPFVHRQADSGVQALLEPVANGDRFQYAVVNVGMFNSADRMAGVLASAGENGWELVTVYDKSSNWLNGMEKGFMLLKRRVPEGATVKQWCVTLNN